MRTFFIASEGVTDFEALQPFLHELARYCEQECCCTHIFPHVDANLPREHLRGWNGLRTWCERTRGAAANRPQQRPHDLELLARAGINLQAYAIAPMPGWAFYRAARGEPATLVFHLDADIAEEIGAHHPNGAFAAPADRREYCRTALQAWTGLAEASALWCVPVHCLETWFLTLHSLDDCSRHMPAATDYEDLSTQQVDELLRCLGHSVFEEANGNTSVNKIDLVATYSQELADNMDVLCARSPSAAHFAHDVLSCFA